ncbi:MAG: HYR domain-containing protein, partial [Chitinophagales bacterium]
GSAFNTGINTVTFRATDASGNSATCAFTVTVSDDDKPGLFANAGFTTAYTQGNQTVGTSTASSTPNLCDGSLTWSHPFYNDNCGVTSGTYTISGATVQAATSFVQGITIANNFNLGISTVLYVVSDAAGNSSTHSFTVTVVDNESPEITATNQSFSAIVASTDCSKAITFTRPNMAGVVDCGSVTMEEKVVSGPDPAVLTGAPAFNPATGGGMITVQFPAGTTKIRYYWVDNVNNKDSVEYTFVAQDTIKPIAQCQNLTRSLSTTAPASYTLTAAEANNGSTDNCPIGISLSITSPANTTFTCANIGTNSYTLQVTDASGNTNSKTCTITILDNTAPVIACPASLSTSTDAGLCTATRSLTALSATDNCGNPVINWTASGASSFSGTGAVVSGTFNRGLTTVTYSVSDGTQTSVCTSTVTLADQQAPVAINCPANITVGANLNPGCSFKYDSNNLPAGWTWNGPISFSDNCQPNFTPAGQPSNGQVFNLGDNTISISAIDLAGNIGLCQFIITVSDQTNPVAVCKNLSRDLSATFPGTVSIPASDFENGSSDNCFLNLTRTVKKGTDPATPFATSVTFACGEV